MADNFFSKYPVIDPTSGTVTSVAMTVPAFLSIAGSPITSSGTLALTLSGTALPIANGGTGQVTANAALNALLPTQTSHSGQFLTTDGTNSSWAAASSVPLLRSVTSTDTATTNDYTLLFSGASFSETIYTAVGNTGRILVLKHNDTSLTKVYTLLTTGGQTIGGIASGSFILSTNGESLTIQSDGANWIILEHFTETNWISAGVIPITAATPPTKGTTTADDLSWKRSGRFVELMYTYSQAAGGTGGTGDYIPSIPANMTVDTAYITANTATLDAAIALSKSYIDHVRGMADGSNTGGMSQVFLYSTTQWRMYNHQPGVFAATWGSGSFALGGALSFKVYMKLPISNWQP